MFNPQPINTNYSTVDFPVSESSDARPNAKEAPRNIHEELFDSANQNVPEKVVLLLSQGANVNHTGRGLLTPLHMACYREFEGIVRILLEATELMPNVRDNQGRTPLHFATDKGNIEIIKRLLEHPQIDVNIQNRMGNSALHQAAIQSSNPTHYAIFTLLLQHNADPKLCNQSGETPIDLLRVGSIN